MPKKKYIKRPFPRKGVDWESIKRKRSRDEISTIEDEQPFGNTCKVVIQARPKRSRSS